MPQRHHRLVRFARSARGLRLLMNAWPPFLFTGTRVRHINADFRHVRVRLGKHLLTSNYFGTQFGGSMFAMVDPFWSIMLSANLGSQYTVWDRQGDIEFLSPGRTAVTAQFTLSEEEIEEIRQAGASGEKVLRWFDNEILDRNGITIARARKQVYVRLSVR